MLSNTYAVNLPNTHITHTHRQEKAQDGAPQSNLLAYILLRQEDLHISPLLPLGASVHRMVLIEFSLPKWSCPDVNLL